MLTIKNIQKALRVPGCSVQIQSIEPINPHPQKTYDMVFTHKDFPRSEFFLVIDRESGFLNKEDKQWYWPISLIDLAAPNLTKFEVHITENNLNSMTRFLDFIDTITQVHKH